jgi:hypothetical protein
MIRDGWPRYYVLVGKVPIAVDMVAWTRAFAERQQTFLKQAFQAPRADGHSPDPWSVADDRFGRVRVSTVFLGLDHNHFGGEPLLFESLIFGGPLDGEMRRYPTWEQAERGHAEMLAAAKKASASITAIKKATGVDQ